MQVNAAAGQAVEYGLRLGDETIALNPLLGIEIKLRHTGSINCVNCDQPTRKSFAQGYCYPCFIKLAECDACIMSPEKCHFAEGTCRDPEWGKTYCMQSHFVYLANSSGLKVGLTRDTPETRWIDQGAVQAMLIARVASRQLAGFVEAALRQYISDRTQWQRMLKGDIELIDLPQAWEDLRPDVLPRIRELQSNHGADAIKLLDESPVSVLSYPVETYPTKVKSLNFDKTPEIGGVLEGIKGQYLIFDTGVINIRKFGGYEVEFSGA
ncbi:MAG: DUF2797 domain-containing protein [Gammaproteobacteria bacterium]|nr:DUF2797 domain-containing protein [Gammaproteobacteria bacterium]